MIKRNEEDKTFIIVEGKRDKSILDFCFQQFYPAEYTKYEIIAFDNPTRTCGTNEINTFAKILFNNRGSNEKYIFVFDNDTKV